MNVVVQAATLADADAIRALDGLSPASGRLLEHDLAAPDRCCLVARSGTSRSAEVVGYVAASFHLDEAQILDVVVAPTWRRHRIATRLLTDLAQRTRDLGVTSTTLEVREDNVSARALYGRLGFVVEGRRPNYYGDGETALIMWQRT